MLRVLPLLYLQFNIYHAEMAEWSNAHDSKSCYVGIRTGVQIPLSAPKHYNPNPKPILVGGAFGFIFYL